MSWRDGQRPVASPVAWWPLPRFPWSGSNSTATRDGTEVWIGVHQ
jgi:hypothetical protein